MSTAVAIPVPMPVWHGTIVSTPGTCGGKPRIEGTRIRVKDVYDWHEVHGMSVAQIMEEYPHLTPAGIHAALSYYWDHRQELHQSWDEEEKWVEEYMKEHPSQLQTRLTCSHGQNHPVSS